MQCCFIQVPTSNSIAKLKQTRIWNSITTIWQNILHILQASISHLYAYSILVFCFTSAPSRTKLYYNRRSTDEWWLILSYDWHNWYDDITSYITDITQWLTWLITSKFETFNFDLMIDFTVSSWIKIEHFSFWSHVTVERSFLLTFLIRIAVFVKKREKLIPIILYIYAAVDSCSATFYYLKL